MMHSTSASKHLNFVFIERHFGSVIVLENNKKINRFYLFRRKALYLKHIMS